MTLDFSYKYQPLFELLTCRKDLSDLESLINSLHPKQVTLEMVQQYERLKELCDVDTVLISGGRDSGKTFGIGCFNVVATHAYNHRILYTRQTMSSTNNSITEALDKRMQLMECFDDYLYANNDYRCKLNNGKISITGQKTSSGTQTAKLKSLEDYSIFETDEGEELTDLESWTNISRSIRAKDVQCLSIISFNPPSKRHWIYTNWYMNVQPGFNGIIGHVMYIHTTYLDNGEDNMAPKNWREYEELRLQYEKYESLSKLEREAIPRTDKLFKNWREYKTKILGGFRDVAEGVIFDYSIGDYVEQEYGHNYGLDQGFTHPSACVKVSICKKTKRVWLKEIYYEFGKTATKIAEALKDECQFERIWVDDARPELVQEMKDQQLNARGAKKPKVKDRINAMLDYEIIIDKSSLNLIAEMDEYRWSDKRLETPVDDMNHAIDAWGYAFYRMVKTKYQQD